MDATDIRSDKSAEMRAQFATVENYMVVGCMMTVSALIGIIFWGKQRKQQSAEELLVGGRSMSVLPVTFSLAASFLSAFTLLGLPAEIYTQGTQFLTALAFAPISALAITTIFLPVFHNLQVPSCYHYLEVRFGPLVRFMVASLSAFSMAFFTSVVLYLPALALEQITGLDVDSACIALFIICVFYTSVGGIKAVIWTDVFQLIFMFVSTGSIIFLTTQHAGGPGAVLERNTRDGRVQLLNTSLDPRERHTVWGTTFGVGFQWMGVFAINQMQVQRYLALPTLSQARKACVLSLALATLLVGLVGWLGLVLYAVYADCDPITAKTVRKQDQLVPFMVLDIAGTVPGLPGLFMAGVFSGSLSTISSGLNALAAVALKDFVSPRMRQNLGEHKQALLTKVFSVLFGVLCYSGTFVIRYFPGMLEVGTLITGVITGPIIGLFMVGMLLPSVNNTGALTSFIGSILLTSWIAVGGRVYKTASPYTSITAPPAPSSTSGCPALTPGFASTNATITPPLPGHLDLYDLSYTWYCAIGAFLVITFSLIYTCLISAQDAKKVDPRLLAPWLPTVREKLPSCFSLASRSMGSISSLEMEKQGNMFSCAERCNDSIENLKMERPVNMCISCRQKYTESIEDLILKSSSTNQV